MTYSKIIFLLFLATLNGCYESDSTEEVSESSIDNKVISQIPEKNQTVQIAPKESTPSKNQDMKIDEKISELEKRRLAMEAKILAAEEKRLAAAEKRLAAAEKRLAAEEKRLASEEKKLVLTKSIQTNTINAIQPEEGISHTKTEKQPPLLAATKPKATVSTVEIANTPTEKEKKKVQSVVSTTKNAAFIKLENQYYLDLYKWELKTEVYRLVKYPDWAKSLGKTGNVSLDFTVNRKSQVSNVNGDNPNVSIQLVSELHRAIMFAAKRVLPPDALPGDSWNMNIAYNFQPHDVEQVALQKPVKPLFLEREHSTVLIDDDNNLEKYQKDVQDIISDRIEYPVWAEKLKQRGKVSFEIVVNQDGSIAEIKPKDVNRHQFLNQEVLRAINDSTPLPSIPEHLRLQSTNMVIQHEFKR